MIDKPPIIHQKPPINTSLSHIAQKSTFNEDQITTIGSNVIITTGLIILTLIAILNPPTTNYKFKKFTHQSTYSSN